MNKSSVLGLLQVRMAAAILSMVGAGCGPSVASYCDKVCDCMGCSATVRADCVDELDDYRKAADEGGCGGEFDDVLSCASSELVCKDDQAQVDGCDAEVERLNGCSSGNGSLLGVANDCDRAADQIEAKYEECGQDLPPQQGSGGECTAELGQQSLCLTGCFAAASCDCVGLGDATQCTSDESSQYLDCLNGC